MTISRRDQLRGLASLPLVSMAGRTFAVEASALLGTWSGMVEDEAGRVHRFRLVISPEGQVNLFAIDIGLVDARATQVKLDASAMDFEFASLGVTVRGALVGRDRIDAVVTSLEGETQKATIHRGDFYSVAVATLLPGQMTRERLRSLLLLSQAPAIGVGWAFERCSRTVLVDGVRSLEAPARVTESDAWHIGSNTKSMTATLVARLVEAGRLRWTTTVGELLSPINPDIRNEYRQATLVDLLSHHAGLPRGCCQSNANRSPQDALRSLSAAA